MSQSLVTDRIQTDITENPVMLFMKGTPRFPAMRLLRPGGADPRPPRRAVTRAANVLEDPPICATASSTISNWPTIPQLYVKGEFVGGCDIIREMFQAGELATLFAEKGMVEPEAAPQAVSA